MLYMTSDIDTSRASRLGGLRRFAIAITILNVVGRAFLGFEQSWAQWLVAIGTAYAMEIVIESLVAWGQRRPPTFIGGPGQVIDFLLSAHIAGNAVSMLLYANDRLLPFAFAAAVAIGSKAIFRVPAGRGTRHFFNPSNLGITTTLLCFSWVGIAAPYMFTENLFGWADWALPAIIVCSGSFLNARFTKRLPLIAGWLGGFVAQALARSALFGLSIVPPLVPITGMAFLLFTFYMVTDPATTPHAPREQLVFGASVAAVYGLLVMVHVVFGIFFALTIVCAMRGIGIYVHELAARNASAQVAPQALAMVGRPEQ
jgi:enediyne biosynthesis protein E5